MRFYHLAHELLAGSSLTFIMLTRVSRCFAGGVQAHVYSWALIISSQIHFESKPPVFDEQVAHVVTSGSEGSSSRHNQLEGRGFFHLAHAALAGFWWSRSRLKPPVFHEDAPHAAPSCSEGSTFTSSGRSRCFLSHLADLALAGFRSRSSGRSRPGVSLGVEPRWFIRRWSWSNKIVSLQAQWMSSEINTTVISFGTSFGSNADEVVSICCSWSYFPRWTLKFKFKLNSPRRMKIITFRNTTPLNHFIGSQSRELSPWCEVFPFCCRLLCTNCVNLNQFNVNFMCIVFTGPSHSLFDGAHWSPNSHNLWLCSKVYRAQGRLHFFTLFKINI